MKTRHFNYKKHPGFILIAVGIIIWLSPFALVAFDNLLGITAPADFLVNNFGILIMTLGPLLVIAGLLWSFLMLMKRSSER